MDDLISRGDVYEVLKKVNIREMPIYVFDKLWNGIRDLPLIEPEERKKGEWIDGTLYYDFDESEWEKVKCSVCENFVTKQIFYHDNKYHYCPYCGADMRGEGDFIIECETYDSDEC